MLCSDLGFYVELETVEVDLYVKGYCEAGTEHDERREEKALGWIFALP